MTRGIFTVGDTANTLVDITASPLLAGKVTGLNGQSVTDQTPLYDAANPFLAGQGNAAGILTIQSGCSYASMDASAEALAAAYNLLNSQGSLVITYLAVTLTLAGAVLDRVNRVEWDGLWLKLEYTFKFTTLVAS